MNKICKLTIRSILLSALFVLMSTSAYADTCTSNADGDWNDDSAIWDCLLDPNAVPVAGDDVVINDSVSFTANIVQVNDITIVNDGTLTQKNTNQQVITGTLTIESGGILTQGDRSTTYNYEIDFQMENLDLQVGGSITAYALGYDGGDNSYFAGEGPYGAAALGNSTTTGGGGGGNPPSGCDFDDPVDYSEYGSGGGGVYQSTPGGSGGGIILLNVNNTATIEASILAYGEDGEDGNHSSQGADGAGGGAGGYIFLSASTIINSNNVDINAQKGDGGPAYIGPGKLDKDNGEDGEDGCVLIEYVSSSQIDANDILGPANNYLVRSVALPTPEFSDSVYLLTLLTALSLIYYFGKSRVYL